MTSLELFNFIVPEQKKLTALKSRNIYHASVMTIKYLSTKDFSKIYLSTAIKNFMEIVLEYLILQNLLRYILSILFINCLMKLCLTSSFKLALSR